MTGLVLANSDYKFHVTSEGEQLQAGLEAAGWTLAGFGYGDGCVDVPTLLERHQPRLVFVTAREDWDETSAGCFNKHCSFKRIGALASHSDIFKVAVVKDCPGNFDRRKAWCEEIKADAVVIYYHEQSMVKVSPWLKDYPLVRTWHTVDRDLCQRILDAVKWRAGAVVSGAKSTVYPLRSMAFENASRIGLATLPHPGYGIRRCHTAEYLRDLSHYKVHLATASIHGFALRKLFESVAVGCVPVTNLPSTDILPEIDGSLVQIPSDVSPDDLKLIVSTNVEDYNQSERLEWAKKCWDFYDWRVSGKALSEEIMRLV